MTVIGITGATGRIGRRVAALLAGATPPAGGDAPTLRLIARDASRAPGIPGTEVAEATFADGAACERAFAGVDVLLLVSAAEAPDRLEQHRTAVRAAAQAGVGHIVYTSFLGASAQAEFTLARDHGATEDAIRAAGPAWTFLRDSFYADVLLDFAGPDRTIRGPAGEGRCAFVAREDVAEVAARVLADPAPWSGRALELTGPVAVTFPEAAQIMMAALGEEFRYVDETIPEARASRAQYDPQPWQLDAWISTYTAIGSGALDVVSQDVREVTGHAPRTIAEVVVSPL
ncbi:SDR family oxidoreductase [Brachybacterium sp. AOP25-B2-12]|uniref:SDR family oxidoreductase n=1 Tax=Brachybacterium sp. AOP25-B2-12 TaxID=3457710 RepID=UPI00403384F2